MARIQPIRQKIIDRAYYLSSHAEDEMVDDRLEHEDIENAILITRSLIVSQNVIPLPPLLNEEREGVRSLNRRKEPSPGPSSC
jgi:hypothetical protein